MNITTHDHKVWYEMEELIDIPKDINKLIIGMYPVDLSIFQGAYIRKVRCSLKVFREIVQYCTIDSFDINDIVHTLEDFIWLSSFKKGKFRVTYIPNLTDEHFTNKNIRYLHANQINRNEDYIKLIMRNSSSISHYHNDLDEYIKDLVCSPNSIVTKYEFYVYDNDVLFFTDIMNNNTCLRHINIIFHYKIASNTINSVSHILSKTKIPKVSIMYGYHKNSINIDLLLSNPNISTLTLYTNSSISYSQEVIQQNDTLLKFVNILHDEISDARYEDIDNKVRENRTFYDAKRFARTKVAAE